MACYVKIIGMDTISQVSYSGTAREKRKAVRTSDSRLLADSIVAVSYLRSLRRTLWIAMGTMLLSALIAMVSGCVLIDFVRTGTSFLHPYLAMFLGLWSVALLFVAVASAFAVKRRIESYMGRILRET
jgi:hypothetical protein